MTDATPPPSLITFQLSPDERDLIIRQSLALDSSLVARLRFALAAGTRLTYTLPEEDVNDLLDALASDANHAADRRTRRSFSRLYERLSRLLREQTTQTVARQESSRGLPPGLRDEVERLIARRDFADLDALNAELAALSHAYNRKPQAELDGLSPWQVARLIYGGWDSPDNAIALNRGIPFPELKESRFLKNTRVLLNALQQSDGTKATSAGNLNRKFIGEMLDLMEWPAGYLKELRQYNKVVNEEDVWSLHINRVVAQQAGLIRKTRGAFLLTKKGGELCGESCAGELFALLFHAYFRKFNLAHLDRVPECPGIQQTIGYSLYVLHQRAGEWQVIEALAPRLYLPAVSRQIPVSPYGLEFDVFLARTRIIEPLENFGLIQCQYSKEKPVFHPEITRVRKSPLYDQFLRFDLTEQA